MNLKKMTEKNRQVDPGWTLTYLDAFPVGFHNRHTRRMIAATDDNETTGGKKRDKKKCKIAKFSRRKNRSAKQQ